MNRLHIPLLSAVTIFFTGCASFFGAGIPTEPKERLRYDIDAVLADPMFQSTIPSIKVVHPVTKEVLYERNSDVYVRPASNMKLLTSATGLHVLGTDYQFKTSIAWDSESSGDTIQGPLYLKGYGNPDLSTKDLETMAKQVAERGIRSITGNIIVDDSFFDSLQWGIGWMWDDEPSPYQAYVSALSANKNTIMVTAAYDTGARNIVVTTEPRTSFVTVKNQATVATDTIFQRLRINRPASEEPNTIVVTGEMLDWSEPYEDYLTILWPELYAGTLLKEALEREGITVSGVVERGELPPNITEKVWHTWGIDSMVVNLNKVSDNLSAEMTLKTLSATVFSPPGNIRSGRSVVNAYFDRLGMDTLRHRMADGSGLSHYSLLRVNLLVDLLTAVYNHEAYFPLFYESLPIAGVDGTIENRMRASRAEDNVRAKTGTISGVSSLSGYVTTRDGDTLVFGMTMQDFIGSSSRYRQAQDRICELLANFSTERIYAGN
jgi:PBP4 family serine-type D-alanyl-D-alanine carboxypeptidase